MDHTRPYWTFWHIHTGHQVSNNGRFEDSYDLSANAFHHAVSALNAAHQLPTDADDEQSAPAVHSGQLDHLSEIAAVPSIYR